MRAFLLLLICAFLGAAQPKVVILSFDGLAARSFNARTMPRVWKLSREARVGKGLPPFPSTTFNGHATIATGCWPEHHGIVANSFVDPKEGFVRYTATAEELLREPLWIAAQRSGVKAAVYHWPCATGSWNGESPWRLKRFRPGTTDADALAFCDAALKDGAQLVMAYLSGMDEEAHHHGPDSLEVFRKLRATDALLAPWIEKARTADPETRIILCADHGFARVPRMVSLPKLMKDIPSRIIAHGGSAFVYLDRAGDADAALARLHRAGLHAWKRADLPARFHLADSPRAGDLIVSAPPGTWVSEAEDAADLAKERQGRVGCHAFDPAYPAMHTWLVVFGQGSGKLGSVPLWDLAPTVADILGIHWRQAPDGKAISFLR
ncbi:MAG TPA: nucleotide pyrophosphatase/phosphodiesterase family protein [Holophagaceae bacterium]|jgi:predicted AlkP superfamily pyrophosphatase or phosphodiesterase|nr:nucleotide pyrophosphatase/phosphodiesterase family protein [Holophagaceae bacterium]